MDSMEKKNPLSEFVRSAMDRVREMADTNTIVGQPITTADGVTLIPVSRVSMGFGGGGGDYGKAGDNVAGGAATSVKIDPVAFLIIKDGLTRVLPVAIPPASTVDRIIEMVPGLLDRVENFFDKKEDKEME